MSDSQKLSRVRWAIRDILQFLQSDRRVQRSRVEKAVRCLKEADFADSAALLEAEFRPVFGGRKRTPELLSFVQSLFDSIDNAVSQRMEHEICPEGVGNTTTPDQPTSNAGSTPTGKTGESEGNAGAGTAPGQEQSPPSPTRETILRQLEPAVRKAYLAFQYAETKNGRRMEDREAYDWLRENGIDHDKGDLGELTDYKLPDSLETFRRYVTEARRRLGESKYTRRGGRKHGGSIVRGDEIEYQKGDGA